MSIKKSFKYTEHLDQSQQTNSTHSTEFQQSLEVKGVSIKLFKEEESKSTIREFSWVQQNATLNYVENKFVNFFLAQIGPTKKSEVKRLTIFNKIKSLIELAYTDKVHVLKYGSDPLKTYLPDSDIDITVVPTVGRVPALTQLKQILEQLENYKLQCWDNGFNDLQISQIMLVDLADVEIIKLTIEDTMVDISIRQTGGLCTILFMNKVQKKVPFLKDSILLLKAWMTYEASLLGSHAANMATYALYILVVFLVNNFEVQSPMEVFKLFFEYFSKFDWESQMVTIFGAIKTLNFYDRLKQEFQFDIKKFAMFERQAVQSVKMRSRLLFDAEDLNYIFNQFQIVRCLTTTPTLTSEQLVQTIQNQNKRTPNLKFVNILDPCLNQNNLGKSISLFNAHRLREALRLQANRMTELSQESLSLSQSGYFEKFVDLFKFTFEMCNVLPPLAVHLPQLSAGKQMKKDHQMSEQLDILGVLQARTQRLKQQLELDGVSLTQIEKQQIAQDLILQLEECVLNVSESECTAETLIEILGGQHLTSDLLRYEELLNSCI